METRAITKPVQSLIRDMEKYLKSSEKAKTDINAVISGISLRHKYQRKEGQWNTLKKSLLIDTFIRDYPTLPIYIVREADNNIQFVLDGIQRLSTIRDFVTDEFAISRSVEPINIDGKLINIAGKKFSKLDEEIQAIVLNYNFNIISLYDPTPEDIIRIFARLNSGKALTPGNLRVTSMSEKVLDVLTDLRNTDFIRKITSPAQEKSDTDRDWLIEATMLIETTDEYDYTSFTKKDINGFVKDDMDNAEESTFVNLRAALDQLGAIYSDSEDLKIPTTSVPMILYGAATVVKDGKDMKAFAGKINEFLENYDSNEEYKASLESGTGRRENVSVRYNYWKNIVAGL